MLLARMFFKKCCPRRGMSFCVTYFLTFLLCLFDSFFTRCFMFHCSLEEFTRVLISLMDSWILILSPTMLLQFTLVCAHIVNWAQFLPSSHQYRKFNIFPVHSWSQRRLLPRTKRWRTNKWCNPSRKTAQMYAHISIIYFNLICAHSSFGIKI